MSGMDRLTELLPCPFCGDNHATTTYTRDGRLVVCTSCGAKSGNYYHGPKHLPSADERAIAAWNRRASQAAPAPSDHLVSVGKASGMVEARVSLAARQIRQTLRDYGHRCAETSLPDLIAADVDAALRKQDEVHAPAPSDGLREAAATILAVLQDPDSLPIEKHPDWQAIYNAMTADHNESVEISGDSWHDWPSILIAGLEVMAQDSAALAKIAQDA